MCRRVLSLIALLAVAPFAHAHGEDILVSFYAQAIAVVVCFAGLQLLPAARAHRLFGFIACIAGVVVADFAVSDITYNDNRIVITIAMVVTPIISTAGGVLVARAYAR